MCNSYKTFGDVEIRINDLKDFCDDFLCNLKHRLLCIDGDHRFESAVSTEAKKWFGFCNRDLVWFLVDIMTDRADECEVPSEYKGKYFLQNTNDSDNVYVGDTPHDAMIGFLKTVFKETEIIDTANLVSGYICYGDDVNPDSDGKYLVKVVVNEMEEEWRIVNFKNGKWAMSYDYLEHSIRVIKWTMLPE